MEQVGEMTSKTTGNKLPIMKEGHRYFIDFSSILGVEKLARIDWKVSKCGNILYDTVHSGNLSFSGFVEPKDGFLLNVLENKKENKKRDDHFFSHIIGDGF